jgi:hypothetical protein
LGLTVSISVTALILLIFALSTQEEALSEREDVKSVTERDKEFMLVTLV